eukprot:6201310-Pleurochrysis_carterae.AAC.1
MTARGRLSWVHSRACARRGAYAPAAAAACGWPRARACAPLAPSQDAAARRPPPPWRRASVWASQTRSGKQSGDFSALRLMIRQRAEKPSGFRSGDSGFTQVSPRAGLILKR